jgi:hypothetical protein
MRAGAEPELRGRMDVEDDILKAFQDQARESSDLRQIIVEKDEALKATSEALEEKDRLIADLKRRLSGP